MAFRGVSRAQNGALRSCDLVQRSLQRSSLLGRTQLRFGGHSHFVGPKYFGAIPKHCIWLTGITLTGLGGALTAHHFYFQSQWDSWTPEQKSDYVFQTESQSHEYKRRNTTMDFLLFDNTKNKIERSRAGEVELPDDHHH